jgi:hypothetical protein
MMILKTSQHADDAKAFIDYVLSPEGQALVADAWLMPARRDVAAKRPLLDALKVAPTSGAAASVAPSCPLQSAVCPIIDTVLRRWPPENAVSGTAVKQKFLSGVTLAALTLLVALPLLFILLQAIFPILAPVRSMTPLAASRRCWPTLS